MDYAHETRQSHAKSIWKAQLFIQENLDEKLTLHQVAKAANSSPYHFHRIFHAFTKETLNHYIRRLRLEKAAGRLKYTQHPVTDIALDSGYETSSSFSRAFYQVMGSSPRRYRTTGMEQLNRLKKTQPNEEKLMLSPEIVNFSSQPVLFVRRVGNYHDTPEKAWNDLMLFATKCHPDISTARKFSVALDNPNITEPEKLRFDACISAPKESIEKGDVGRQILKGGKYAVFLHQGPYEELEQTFDTIFQKWYPDHKNEVKDQPCFCEHMNMELIKTNPDELITKIYVPLN